MNNCKERFGRIKVSNDPVVNLQFKLRFNMTHNPARDKRKLERLIEERKNAVN